jgi:hypothetical protein
MWLFEAKGAPIGVLLVSGLLFMFTISVTARKLTSIKGIRQRS